MDNFFSARFQKLAALGKRMGRYLAEHFFGIFLVLFVISLLAGALVYYQYSFAVIQEEPLTKGQPMKFLEGSFTRVLDIWQNHEDQLRLVGTKEYRNIFR